MQQHTFDTLSMARGYVAAGLSIIPITPGQKTPAPRMLPTKFDEQTGEWRATWEPFQRNRPTEADLIKWYGQREHGIGIVGGAISGGLVVIDLESLEAYTTWRDHAATLVDAATLDSLPIVSTGKGCHIYFRMESPIGNRKLAMAGKTVIAETRGEGGYVLAPPSVHPSSVPYQLQHGDLCAVPQLEAWQAHALLDAARALAPEQPHPTSTGTGLEPDKQDIIGAYNKAHTIEQVLEAHGYTYEKPGRYIRPGGERSSVQIRNGRSTHYNTADPLHSEAPGGGHYAHSPFSAFCVLAHQGNVKAAVRAAGVELGLIRSPLADDLLAQAGRGLGLHDDDPADTWPYFEHQGGIWMHRSEKDGTPKTPLLLCNFTARITAETTLDDGEEQENWYTLEVRNARRTKTIEMKRHEFESEGAIGRLVAALGARARVNPQAQPRYLLDAIKAFSCDVQEHTRYTHTGWVDGRYLFANGYVDRDGWHATGGAQLPQRLHSYRLDPPAAHTLPDALHTFDHLCELAPPPVIVPLLGAILLAPIAPALRARAPMVHLYGQTGSHKTSLTCAAMALWGDFAPNQPTDTWTSTSYSIQRLGWHLKNAPVLIDDYKNANVKSKENVIALLQNYGDGLARGRLDANSELRTLYPIRGVLLSSGEDQPAVEGEAAILARILSVPLSKGAVHRGNLTAVQSGASGLPLLTIAYLQWLAQRPAGDDLAQLYITTRNAMLAKIEGESEHATNPGRIAGNTAALYVAWARFLQFISEREYWPREHIELWRATAKRELLNLARSQLAMTTEERYSQVLLEAIRTLVAAGKCVLLNGEGESREITAAQTVIGTYDRMGVYLIAGEAHAAVVRHYRSAGRDFGCSQRALSQMFHAEGLLRTTTGGLQVRRRVNGVCAWCWHLPQGILEI